MKPVIVVAAAALALVPAVASSAAPVSSRGGSWDFTDYTADPVSLAADDAFHAATGATISSYCHGSRVPSAPQDVNAHSLALGTKSVLTLSLAATGVWGLDLQNATGGRMVGMATVPPSTTATKLTVRLSPGRYTVVSCNLGGAPTAHVTYQVTPVRK